MEVGQILRPFSAAIMGGVLVQAACGYCGLKKAKTIYVHNMPSNLEFNGCL